MGNCEGRNMGEDWWQYSESLIQDNLIVCCERLICQKWIQLVKKLFYHESNGNARDFTVLQLCHA